MKLTTIWTIPAMTLTERLRRTHDAAMRTIAAHLPKRIAYWNYIHQGIRAIEDNEVVPDVTFCTVLSRLDGGPR